MINTKNRTILIIDDELAIRQSYADFLEDLEYNVFTAENGRVGLEIFSRENVDLVLVDLRMPEVDGLEVLARMKQINPSIPSIVISGTGVINDAIEAVRQGAWDFLLKPINDFSILTHAIDKVLEKATLMKENEEYHAHLKNLVDERTHELKEAYDNLSDINKKLRLLVERTRKLSFSTNIEDFCTRLLIEFSKQLDAGGGSLFLKEKDGLRLVYSLDSNHVPDFLKFPLNDDSVFGHVISNKECILVEKNGWDNNLESSGWKGYESNSFLAFPIFNKEDEISGILSLHNPHKNSFTIQDKEIGLLLASFSLEAIKAMEATKSLKESEEQYHQAQKMESIGRLAGGVAHDLNNLLTPILGYGEILLDDFSGNDSRRESVEEILSAGMRAKDLIRQLLAFSRKQTLEYKTLDLIAAFNGFKKLLRRTIRENIEIVFPESEKINPILADIGQIEQVIMNLSVNAADAMPDGGLLEFKIQQVNIKDTDLYTSNDIQPGDYVLLSVTDDGSGMDERTLLNLFEPFYSTKGERGTGLGLSTVYGIVKQHCGFIEVISELDKGSTFKIYLPTSEDKPELKEIVTPEIVNPSGHETILLVEDNEQVRHISHTILKRQGYSVLAAGNGEEAISLLESYNGKIDLLLSDMVMPGMNGKELYSLLLEDYPNLKAIFMSGYTEDLLVYEEVMGNDIDFIQKPFTFQSFSTKIRDVLEM